MKKILMFALFFVCLVSYAQGTTQKEYNYLTVGYKEDLASGKDIISGYKISKISTKETAMNESGKTIFRKSTLFKLIRNQTKKIAAFLIVEERLDNGNQVFICIPNKHSDQLILKQACDFYFKKLSDTKCMSSGATYSYSWNNLLFLSDILSN